MEIFFFFSEMRDFFIDCGKRTNREGEVEDTGETRNEQGSATVEWGRKGTRRSHVGVGRSGLNRRSESADGLEAPGAATWGWSVVGIQGKAHLLVMVFLMVVLES